jgi:hypothetical protein
MDAAEEQLWISLVAFVGGSRLVASAAQVASHLHHHFDVSTDEVRACHYRAGSFLLCFHDDATMDQVLHAPRPPLAELTLIFSRYTR